MTNRYQYIVTYLALRDSIAVQTFAMAVMLVAPFPLLHRWPRLVWTYAIILTALGYALVALGVIVDVGH